MNCITLQPIIPNESFPWFDEWAQHNTFCKIYHDGGSYVAIPQGAKIPSKKRYPGMRTTMDDLFDELYRKAISENIPREDLAVYLTSALKEFYPNDWNLADFVARKIAAAARNLAARKKRFRRKAYLNSWNYLVTITYDDEKFSDEEDFRKRLRKCLSNLHTRREWLYMGVFERAPETGRLHLHALVYVPEGQMIGEIFERRDYSTKLHQMQTSHGNTFFDTTFGRSDFSVISDGALHRGNVLNYVLKYLEKTDERIIYSRGIPTEFSKVIGDDEIVAEMLDFCVKYVLYDDVIDYDVDVARIKAPPLMHFPVSECLFLS